MSDRPNPTHIYHITHVDNLASIAANGGLLSDADIDAHGGPGVAVGMSEIKLRRMGLPVKCHPGDVVGAYVPFYFCPRSIMLYILYMANHPQLTYRGGQGPIVHLQANADKTIEWAAGKGVPWAFSFGNAGAAYTSFGKDVAQLDEIDWDAVAARNFRPAEIKEKKQAEFLVKKFVPWELIERVGVLSEGVQVRATAALAGASHNPPVDICPRWYF
jgi:hypothetical protein